MFVKNDFTYLKLINILEVFSFPRFSLLTSRGDKDILKNIFGGKRDFVKMCQVRCPKQPLKVPTPQLRRSLNCDTFSPPKITFSRITREDEVVQRDVRNKKCSS